MICFLLLAVCMVVVIVVPVGFWCGLFGYFACRFGFRVL